MTSDVLGDLSSFFHMMKPAASGRNKYSLEGCINLFLPAKKVTLKTSQGQNQLLCKKKLI
jgi:hypothetical protein